MRAELFAGLLAVAACGDSPVTTPDATAADAAGFPTTCTGDCRTTALTATFGSAVRVLDRAYYGVTTTLDGATLHVEAHLGGSRGCPTAASPTPDYTLVLGTVPIPTSAGASRSAANILDFVGDLLGGPLGAAATMVALTPVAADICVTCVGMTAPSDPDGLLALDVTLTFDGGTLGGHLFATHCDGLDSQE